MTFIQHHKSNLLQTWMLWVLVALTVVASVWLVYLYNRAVNLKHGISEVQNEIERIQTENSELKEEIFVLLDSDKFREFAAERGLVQERDPRYFELDRKWSLASHL